MILKKSGWHYLILIVLWIAVHILILNGPGLRDDLVDATGYMAKANFLTTHGYLQAVDHFFYLVLILIIAGSKWLVPAHPGEMVVFIQSVLSLAAALALYHAGLNLFNKARAGLIAAILYLLWFDVIQWNLVVMTDSIACSLVCLFACRLTMFRGTSRDFTCIFILATLCMLTRPTALVIVVAFALFLLNYYKEYLQQHVYLRWAVLVFILLLSVGTASIMFTEWDFTEQLERGNIVTYMNQMEGHSYYSKSLQLDTVNLRKSDKHKAGITKLIAFVWRNPVYMLKAGVYKVFFLMTGVRPYYSAMHNSYTVVWLLLMYTGFVIGVKGCLNYSFSVFCISIMVLNCLLIGISSVDWDNRFYLPMAPGIAIMAGGGFHLWIGKRFVTTSS